MSFSGIDEIVGGGEVQELDIHLELGETELQVSMSTPQNGGERITYASIPAPAYKPTEDEKRVIRNYLTFLRDQREDWGLKGAAAHLLRWDPKFAEKQDIDPLKGDKVYIIENAGGYAIAGKSGYIAGEPASDSRWPVNTDIGSFMLTREQFRVVPQ